MKSKRDLLVTLADMNYIQQAKQLFSSVYWNAGWKGEYMLLAHEIPDDELAWFRNKGFLIKKCEPLNCELKGDREYPKTVMDKFYLFTEEFKKWEHIVFLDGDIIVRASLDRLTKTKTFASPKTTNNYFRYYFYLGEHKDLEVLLEEEYNINRPAFNSGVMSFNTDMIKNDTFDKLVGIFKKYAPICNGDDEILNLFFFNRWTKLPIVYNVLIYQVGFKKQKGIILHFNKPASQFIGKNIRPWDMDNPYYQEWKANLDKAEYIDLNKIQKGKKWNVFKIKYYSLLINIFNVYNELRSSFFRHKMEAFFRFKLKSFFCYRLRLFFIYVIKTPDRLFGSFGVFLKKRNPDLYYKLRKIKDGK